IRTADKEVGADKGGRGVAGTWRIRHKLMLGLGLVVAIMALVLAGTLKGLFSYRATILTFHGKLDALKGADKVLPAVKALAAVPPDARQAAVLAELIDNARERLADYRNKLEALNSRRRDAGDGGRELEQANVIEKKLNSLSEVIAKAVSQPQLNVPDNLLE